MFLDGRSRAAIVALQAADVTILGIPMFGSVFLCGILFYANLLCSGTIT